MCDQYFHYERVIWISIEVLLPRIKERRALRLPVAKVQKRKKKKKKKKKFVRVGSQRLNVGSRELLESPF